MAEADNMKNIQRLQKLREALLLYSMPFWYGIITRLPFIYFVIHMRFQFDLDWYLIGVFVGCYQAARVLIGVATVLMEAHHAHFMGISIALAGNLVVLVVDSSLMVPFLVGTICIGFAETLACMQTYVKSLYVMSSLNELGHKLKLQYAAVCVGVTLGFALGGVVYEFGGITGIAIFGTSACLMELMTLIAFLVIDKTLRKSDIDGTMRMSTEISEESLHSKASSSSGGSISGGSSVSGMADDSYRRVYMGNEHPFVPAGQLLQQLDHQDSGDEDDNPFMDSFQDFMASFNEGFMASFNHQDYEEGCATEISEEEMDITESFRSHVRKSEKELDKAFDEFMKEANLEEAQEEAAIPKEDILMDESGRSVIEASITMANSFSASEAGPNFINWVMAITFAMEAITIGYNLSVSPVFISERFGYSSGTIGILLSAGAAVGTMISIAITLTKQGKKFADKILPSPNNFFVGMAGISVTVMLCAVPSFPVYVFGLVALMGINDYAAIVLNEMQGSLTSEQAYRTMAPMGQIIRRCGNVVTAVTGPYFFGILPTLPYLVAGTATAAWTLLLIIVVRDRMKQNTKTILEFKENQKLSGSEEDVKKMGFVRQEVVARLMKRCLAASKLKETPLEASFQIEGVPKDHEIDAGRYQMHWLSGDVTDEISV